MDNLLDVFNADGFSLSSMTDRINKRPFIPGRIGELGLFTESGINTLTAQIEEKEGVLYLVPAQVRGGPATQNLRENRRLRPLNVVHLPVKDTLMADEIQGVRAFGQVSVMETIEGKVNEKLQTIAESFEATHEFHRVGAVKGVVYDADGTTVLYNLFEEFQVTQLTPVSFDLDADDPVMGDVRKKCNLVVRQMEDALGATKHAGVHAMVGSDFLDALVDHPECREAWKRWQDGEALRASFVRRTFPYAGVMFEEYRGKVGSIDFFEANEARFFPLGVPGLFRCVYAPANYIETVNTTGLPMYSKTIVKPNGTGVDIEAQSNPLPYCVRPRVLRTGLLGS